MLFKLNCDRCGALLNKGEIYNHKDKRLCDDCYILLYMFSQKVSDALLPNVRQLSRKISTAVVLQLSTER